MSEGERIELLGWPDDRMVYLTLDLECDYGTALSDNTYEAAKRTRELSDILERFDVPLSVFLQTEVIEAAPEAITGLAEATVPVEFHAHSHTHPRRGEADAAYEIAESVRRVRDQFGTTPIGYRFPNGESTDGDYRRLATEDVAFSATSFPSWFPGRFNNSSAPMIPSRHLPTDVVELPFTVYSPRARVPVSLSYIKLLGRGFGWLTTQYPPNAIVFDMHMHDFFVPSAYSELSRPYQAVYARRMRDGPKVFERFVETMKRQGYEFGLMSELYQATRSEGE